MERDKSTFIKPGDLLFVGRGNGTSMPHDGPLKDAHTSDARQNTNGNLSTAQRPEQIDQHAQPSSPIELPVNSHIDGIAALSLESLLQDVHALETSLDNTYKTTTSHDIKQVIAGLVTLDHALARQTTLNEQHEAHTAKNFKEQRVVNKDRQLRIRDTIKSVNSKFAAIDTQQKAQDLSIKQSEVKLNSHQLQIKGLGERVTMLAEGGEWAEGEISEIKRDIETLREEVELLEMDNQRLEEQVRGLKDEVGALKEKEGMWEKRLCALEELVRSQKDTQSVEGCIEKERIVSASAFAVGNYRVFSTHR
jgi:chromosome segregation ATPase